MMLHLVISKMVTNVLLLFKYLNGITLHDELINGIPPLENAPLSVDLECYGSPRSKVHPCLGVLLDTSVILFHIIIRFDELWHFMWRDVKALH